MPEKACVVGLGFIGLPLSVALASRGADILGYELREEVVEKINKGEAPIYEPGLEEELKKVVEAGKIKASSNPEIIKEADIVIITVGTPVDDNGVPKLDYVKSACEIIGKNLKKNAIVVLKSTVPPGTTEEIVKPLLEQSSGMKCPEDFGVAFCPERTVEGQAMKEFLTLPKVVGGINQETTDRVSEFFSILNDKIVKVSKPRTAELVKLMDNTYRDVNIALANEFAEAGMALGVDVIEAIEAANQDYSRNHILIPGAGVGGSCLTKDPLILNTTVKEKGGPTLDLVLQGRETNKKMPEVMIELAKKVLERNEKTIENSKIALLGLAFKRDTNDLRHTPTKDIYEKLSEKGTQVIGYDKFVDKEEVKKFFGEIELSETAYDACKDADLCMILTDHSEFSELNLTKLKEIMKTPAIVDGRHMIDPKKAIETGFDYEGLGRPKEYFISGKENKW